MAVTKEIWRPIAEADNGIAYVHELADLRIGNSYPVWARDEDGRIFEAVWSDNGKKAYWWDLEGESPVDPVEFMPHPLDPRFSSALSRSAEAGKPVVKGVEEAIDAIVAGAEVEWSYHEDDDRYPRDFWHARISFLGYHDTWTSYGKQEQRDLPDDVKSDAEKSLRGELRSALREALSALSTPADSDPVVEFDLRVTGTNINSEYRIALRFKGEQFFESFNLGRYDTMDREQIAILHRIRDMYPSVSASIAAPVADREPVSVPEWRDGAPPKPWADEWFIAETTYGDRVVLTSLPEEWPYDFKTADETYIKADKIKRWMQFPDSQFIAPAAPQPNPSAVDAGSAVLVERLEAAAWPISTDDQVEALASECDWDNRKYMTPKDYAIWCERMRKFARLAVPSQASDWATEHIDRLTKALEPFSTLQIPKKAQYNAGAYSIRHSDIEAARAALSSTKSGEVER